MTQTHQATAGQTDRQLMEQISAGDRAAFAELMSRHQDMVFAVALRIMRNRHAALDATQDTFVTVLRKADRYSGEAQVSTWLYRVATNKSLDHLRHQKRRRAVPLAEYPDLTDPNAGAPLDAIEVRSDIGAALASIPNRYRAAVVMSDVEGLTISEIGKILGLPTGTVKSRVFRGRRMLADKLHGLREPSPRIATPTWSPTAVAQG